VHRLKHAGVRGLGKLHWADAFRRRKGCWSQPDRRVTAALLPNDEEENPNAADTHGRSAERCKRARSQNPGSHDASGHKPEERQSRCQRAQSQGDGSHDASGRGARRAAVTMPAGTKPERWQSRCQRARSQKGGSHDASGHKAREMAVTMPAGAEPEGRQSRCQRAQSQKDSSAMPAGAKPDECQP
jgi:hypothetical protein